MRLFLKNKKVQAARIILLLTIGVALNIAAWIALNLKIVPPWPVWIVCVVISIIGIYTIISTE